MATLLRRELQSGSRRFILIADEVASTSETPSPIQVAQATIEHANVYVDTRDVEDMRREHPDVPVYGFWQALLAGGVIDVTGTWDSYVYYENRESEDGLVLSIVNGYATASLAFQGGLPAAVQMYRPREVTEEDLAGLTLPSQPVLLPSEVAAFRRAPIRKHALVAASTCGVGLALCAAVDVALVLRANSLEDRARDIDAQAAEIRAEANQLKAVRDPLTLQDRQRNHLILTRLSELVAESVRPNIADLRPAVQSNAVVEVAAIPTTLSFPILVEYSPATVPTITYSVDGSQPPAPVEETQCENC